MTISGWILVPLLVLAFIGLIELVALIWDSITPALKGRDQ